MNTDGFGNGHAMRETTPQQQQAKTTTTKQSSERKVWKEWKRQEKKIARDIILLMEKC